MEFGVVEFPLIIVNIIKAPESLLCSFPYSCRRNAPIVFERGSLVDADAPNGKKVVQECFIVHPLSTGFRGSQGEDPQKRIQNEKNEENVKFARPEVVQGTFVRCFVA